MPALKPLCALPHAGMVPLRGSVERAVTMKFTFDTTTGRFSVSGNTGHESATVIKNAFITAFDHTVQTPVTPRPNGGNKSKHSWPKAGVAE
jgi:hypothetical protein